jgi:hypothetical protein
MPLTPDKIAEIMAIAAKAEVKVPPGAYERPPLSQLKSKQLPLKTHKEAVRRRTRAAVKRGEIKPPADGSCEGCASKTRLYIHHNDYSNDLDVTWLCSKCHYKVHH